MEKNRERMTVLLLDDQPLIAMDTEAILRQAGFAQIVHFASVAPALAWLAASEPDLAVIEVTLQNEPSIALAQQLISRNVPFLIYSGANRALLADRIFHEAEWVSKPSEIEMLDPAISRVLGAE
jgi:DNA-binding NtrC family response regulator